MSIGLNIVCCSDAYVLMQLTSIAAQALVRHTRRPEVGDKFSSRCVKLLLLPTYLPACEFLA